MPIDYSKYPPDWKERRQRILKRAKNKCETCGIKNYSIGYWVNNKFITVKKALDVLEKTGKDLFENILVSKRPIKIVLTIAHLDHDEENFDVKDDRLRTLCQRCHLRYDVKEKKKRRFKKKHKTQINMEM
jgi:hypothetical protein